MQTEYIVQLISVLVTNWSFADNVIYCLAWHKTAFIFSGWFTTCFSCLIKSGWEKAKVGYKWVKNSSKNNCNSEFGKPSFIEV